MTYTLTLKQQILCSQLEKYLPKIKDAYLGAIWALNAKDYDDRLVHFAHSLREVIDLLARKNQTDKERRHHAPNREILLESVIDPARKQVYTFNHQYEKLASEYKELSEYAHHNMALTQKNAENKLKNIEGILSHLTRPQTEILEEMDKIISSEPSTDKARQLMPLLFRTSSDSHMLENLSCTWLESLRDAGFFMNVSPASSKHKKQNTLSHWTPSKYLLKCVGIMPDLVTEIILKCKFKEPNSQNPTIYDDFLRCALVLSENNMVKIAQKAISEGWHRFIGNYHIVVKYADLAESLYLGGKHHIASELMRRILNSGNASNTQPYHAHTIGQILNEKIPRLAERNPLGIAMLLASFLEDTAKNTKSKPSDMPDMTLKSIKNYEHNYLWNDVRDICIVHLRNCLIKFGDRRPVELKVNMNILSEKQSHIFRGLELFLYDRYPEHFDNEIARSLVDFCHIPQVRQEYDYLLKSTFGGLDETVQRQIIDLIWSGLQQILDKCETGRDESAYSRHTRMMLKKLYLIHGYLDNEQKERYGRLVHKYGLPPFLDFEQAGVSIGDPVPDPDLFSGKSVDEVFDIMKEYNLAPNTALYEDETTASFEDFVKNNVLACSKKSSETVDLNPRIQHTFLTAMGNSINMGKRIDWNSVIPLIEEHVGLTSSGRSSSTRFNFMLELCRIIERGLNSYQIDFKFRERIWDLVQKFIELSNSEGDVDIGYPGAGSDSSFTSLNSIGGVSFHALFRYIWWCYRNEKSSDVFTSDIKKILEDYVKRKIGSHTMSRHSTMGVYLPTMLYFEPKWTNGSILSKIASSKPHRIAFWDSFVLHNQAREYVFTHMYRLYDVFLNGAITNDMHEKRFYRVTIEHVTLGYLYGIRQCDAIFQKFISKAEPASIRHCGVYIAQVLGTKREIAKLKDKITMLWQNQKFIDHADLNMWFVGEPFDKKENMRLFLNYMTCAKKFGTLNFPIEKLNEYVDDFPSDVVTCLDIFVGKADSNNLPDALEPTLERLCSKKVPGVGKIIEELVNLDHNNYRKLLPDCK